MVRLNVNMPALHEGYHARWDCAHGQKEDGNYWRTEMPLLAQGHIIGRVEIIGERNHEPVWEKIISVLELVNDFENDASSLVDSIEPAHGADGILGRPDNGTVRTMRETAISEPVRRTLNVPHFSLPSEQLGDKHGREPFAD